MKMPPLTRISGRFQQVKDIHRIFPEREVYGSFRTYSVDIFFLFFLLRIVFRRGKYRRESRNDGGLALVFRLKNPLCYCIIER